MNMSMFLIILLIIIVNSYLCNGLITKLVSKQINIFTIKSINDNNYNDIETLEGIEGTLLILQNEKDKKKLELLAVNIAIRDLENDLKRKLVSNSISKPIIKGSYDYGFSSKSTGSLIQGVSSVKGSTALFLAVDNFKRELNNIINVIIEKSNNNQNSNEDEVGAKLKLLTLNNDAIWKRKEFRRDVSAPYIIKIPYLILCKLLDVLFEGRPINRFYFLETVARMPYFSYILMLHLYETLGWWRRSTEVKRIHFAEEYNEFHHLLIWESLGGDQEWYVRFFAQHCAVAYFFGLSILWIISPTLAYNFSELIESHAVDTYAQFAEENRELLESLSPPPIAKAYYEALDMYIFDEFQTATASENPRRPIINTLYDVIINIRDDEKEHVNTMGQCQDPTVAVTSKNTEAAITAAAAATAAVSLILSGQYDISLDELNDVISDAKIAGSSIEFDVEETSESLPMIKQLFNILKNIRL